MTMSPLHLLSNLYFRRPQLLSDSTLTGLLPSRTWTFTAISLGPVLSQPFFPRSPIPWLSQLISWTLHFFFPSLIDNLDANLSSSVYLSRYIHPHLPCISPFFVVSTIYATEYIILYPHSLIDSGRERLNQASVRCEIGGLKA